MSNPADLLFSQPQDYSPHLLFGDDTSSIAAAELSIDMALPGVGVAASVAVVVPVQVAMALPGVGVSGRVVADVALTAAVSLPGVEVSARIAPLTEIAIAGTLPDVAVVLTLDVSIPVAIAMVLPGLQLAAAVQYQSNTQRPTVGQTAALWRVPDAALSGAAFPQQVASKGAAWMQAPWQQARIDPHGINHPLPPALQASPISVQAPQQDATGLPVGSVLQQQDATQLHQPRTDSHQEAQRTHQRTGFRHQDGDHSKRASRATRYQDAKRLHRPQLGRQQKARWAVWGWKARHQDGRVPPIGITLVPVVPKPPPFVPDPNLLFGDAIVITPQRAYIVINSITLHRLDTGAELHAHGFSMSLDYQSWTWQWSASLHHNAEAHLGRDAQGDPPVLVASVNGTPFRLRLEKLSRDRRFNPTRWAVSGRGLAATLAAPWSPKQNFGNTADRTAQQLMQDVLSVNGVPLGWDLDWQLTDWLVPSGAWAMQGSTIEAITDIAGSVGGYVQPHATDPVLRILPKYPAAPWRWASDLPIDFDLPKDLGEVEGTEYIDKYAYNRVFVGGQSIGVSGPVTRAGTAGGELAPQVLHPLITHADAHRQRGLAELSDTGTQEQVTLSLQVLPELGVIIPGQTILYRGHDKDYRGIVRGTSISWQSPKLRQTIVLETHPHA